MALSITGIAPNTGPKSGGNTVLITGTDLNTVTTVTIGGTPAVTFTAENAFLLRAVVPAHAAGAVSVVIGDGTTTQTLAGGYTFTAVDASEPLVSTLARKFRVDVNTGTLSVPVWTQVRAVTDFKPARDNNLEEDDDYDSDGYGSKTKTMINWGAEIKVGRKIGFSTGVYDPGQEALRLASEEFGADGSMQIRYYDRNGGPEAYMGIGTISWEPEGGEAKALDVATCKIDGQGKLARVPNPVA
ncbi:phage tail tube protein [Actinomadura rubrisoli]|uniref:IPT/TIG domain-containing protein n=1 Tax=Actinomadura rubrisoli TaxID=2530368 RepID=A0A4R5BYG9_9ACTN|nr:IPT/TIG domain-containing protein [Actinomadura rubrisoli]TDD90773.1 hypothetical protein E1298_12795 [Actinomadura rubrisoli]